MAKRTIKSEVVETAEAPVVEAPVVEAVQKPKVGERARQLIREGIMDNKGILEQIKKEYPDAKTSMACIAWYKSDIKKTKSKDDQPFRDWCKANGFDEASLRAKFKAEQVTA